MSPSPLLISDQQRLHDHLTRAKLRGRVIGPKTALELASWFTEAVGPGFEVFLTTGAVTGHLYGELGRLYDLRTDEAGHWLNNLTRYVARQPIMATRGRPAPREDGS